MEISRLVQSGLVLVASLAGCSSAKDELSSSIIRCTAEALKASRNPSLSAADQDRWRSRAVLLEEKLSPTKHNETHSEAERLAHTPAPLIDPVECDALLTEADRTRLLGD